MSRLEPSDFSIGTARTWQGSYSHILIQLQEVVLQRACGEIYLTSMKKVVQRLNICRRAGIRAICISLSASVVFWPTRKFQSPSLRRRNRLSPCLHGQAEQGRIYCQLERVGVGVGGARSEQTTKIRTGRGVGRCLILTGFTGVTGLSTSFSMQTSQPTRGSNMHAKP